MISWEQYALSVIGCVLFSECIIYLSENLHYEKIIRLVCGALLTITVLEPIISLDGFDYKNFDTEQFHSEEFVNAGKMAATLRTLADDLRQGCPMGKRAMLFDYTWDHKYVQGLPPEADE